jgi:hypothetical protein
MAYNWGRVRDKINAAVEKYGGSAFIVRGSTSYPVKFIVGEFRVQERPGNFIEESDARVFVSVGTLTIEPDQEQDRFKFMEDIFISGVNVRGMSLRIVTPKPVNPAGVSLVYDMIVRR